LNHFILLNYFFTMSPWLCLFLAVCDLNFVHVLGFILFTTRSSGQTTLFSCPPTTTYTTR
jgi:hypothetical protein